MPTYLRDELLFDVYDLRVKAQDQIGVEQLPNDAQGRERFWIVYIDAEKANRHNGYVRSTTNPMLEPEVREFFEKGNQPPDEVEEMFRSAREQFARRRPG